MRRRDEEGTIALLVVGFTAVLLLLVAVVVDVSVVILARRSAASIADGAAIAAAQQIDRTAVYEQGLGPAVVLSPLLVDQEVADYLLRTSENQPGLTLTPSLDVSQTIATVTATREVTLPFVGWFGVQAVTVTAVAHARAPVIAP